MNKCVSNPLTRSANAVGAYNASVGALESRVLVSARKFQQLKVTVGDKDIPVPAQVETIVRVLTSQDLMPQLDLVELPPSESDDVQVVAEFGIDVPE